MYSSINASRCQKNMKEDVRKMYYTKAVESYIHTLISANKAETTIQNYTRTLRSFGSYLESVGIQNVEDIKPATLVDWKDEVGARISPSSLRLYVNHLHTFFEFCADIEFVARSPFKKSLMSVAVKESDCKDTNRNVLSEKEFHMVLTNQSPSFMYKKFYARNRAILALFVTSGLRCSSLCALTPADLDWDQGTVCVRNAKGGKNGFVLFSDVAKATLRRYLESGCRPSSWTDTDPLFGFADSKGQWRPFARNAMSNLVEAAARGFSGHEGVRTHALRHTAASFLRKHGFSDGEVSLFLMHSDGTGATVTNRYIRRDYSALFDKANRIFNRIAHA